MYFRLNCLRQENEANKKQTHNVVMYSLQTMTREQSRRLQEAQIRQTEIYQDIMSRVEASLQSPRRQEQFEEETLERITVSDFSQI